MVFSPSPRVARRIISNASILALIFGVPAFRSQADNYIWGGGSGLWSDGTKWLPKDNVPFVGDGVTIGGGNVTLDFSALGYGSVDHLTLSGILGVQGNPYGGGVELHAVNNIDINAGAILDLTSADPASAAFSSAVRAQTINNHGFIFADPGTGGTREIQAYTELQNFSTGIITANTSMRTFGNITNAGAFNVNVGTTNLFDGGFINTAGGSVTVKPGAYMLMGNATFYFLGGTINGEIELQNNTTLFASTADGLGAKFAFTRLGGQLISNLPVNTNVRVIGNAVGGSIALTVPGSVINYGNITLETDDGPFSSGLNVTAGTLTNNGFIFLNPARGGGPRVLSGTFVNNFGIYDDTTTATSGSTTLIGDFTNNNVYERFADGVTTVSPVNTGGSIFRQKAGQLVIHPGGSFIVQSGTFAFGGGSINGGSVTLISGSHLQTTTADGHGAVFTFAGNGSIDTDLSYGVHVNMSGANGTVTVKDGAVNHGTIELFNTESYFTGLGLSYQSCNVRSYPSRSVRLMSKKMDGDKPD